jgi:hypothetical protein
VEAAVVLVVVADGVDLRLAMTQFVHALAQRREPGGRALQMAGQVGEVPVCRVLQGRDALDEQLDGVQVAGVRQRQVTLALGEAIQDGVQPLVLLGLVLVVGVHGQPEGVLPAVPVVDLDALVAGVRKELLTVDVSRLPVQVAGEQRVALLERQLAGRLRGGFLRGHAHVSAPSSQ